MNLRAQLPILDWLPGYRKQWLRPDLIAGLTVVALLIPEGMAYAQLAGVPPQTAFYAAPIGLLIYAILGTSRQLVVAVSAAIATMSFATVSQIAEPGSGEFIVLTTALALLSGAMAVVAGVLKLGRVAQFFSESVMVGFISGLALVIAVKQVPKLIGIEGSDGNFWERTWHVLANLHETHGLTLAVGIGGLVVLVGLEHFFERVPAALVALTGGIVVSALFSLDGHGVHIVGDIPSGLVAPAWPSLTWAQWSLLAPGALGMALVAFAEAVGPARSFAAEHHDVIDPDQEFIGLGAANVGAGLFQGFPIGSSLSKSAANDRAGAQTQMSGIIAAGVTVVVALFFTGLFRELPEAVLGAIVIVAVSGMFKASQMIRLFHIRRADFFLAAVAFLAVLTFETLQALLVAVVVSLLALVANVSQPRVAVLGRVPGQAEFTDLRRHPDNTPIPGMLIVRPENGLFFANAAGFRESILAEVAAAEQPVRTVLIDLDATTTLDVPSAEMLGQLHEDLHGRNVDLMLARVIAHVRPILERTGVVEQIGPDNIFRGPDQAVAAYTASQHP